MKKIIAICLTVIMIFAFTVPSFAANNNELQFNEDGKFKIAVIADPQDGHPTSEILIAYMNEMLDDVKPDLVVFLGDNITGEPENQESFDELLTPVVSRNIPFTLVFGNHDAESCEYYQELVNNGTDHYTASCMTKEMLLAKYQEYAGCLAYDADQSLHGVATHNLPILSSDGTKVAFNLWLMDSGDYAYDADDNCTGYDCVRKDQIEWYENVSKELEQANGGLVPSIVFQHIITEEAVGATFVESDFSLGDTLGFTFNDGKTYTIFPNLGNIDGILMEKSCPSMDNDGQWDALVERGDVLAVASGHDHVNDFKVTVDGIDYLNINGISYASYGKSYLRGAKIITLDENNAWEYTAETAYIYDYALKSDSTIPGSKIDYVFGKVMNVFLTKLMKALNEVFAPFKTN